MSDARVENDVKEKIRSREPFISTAAPSLTRTNCNDPSDNAAGAPLTGKSFDFGYDTQTSFDKLPFTNNIFEAHRADPDADIATVKVSAEYTKNLRMSRDNATDTKSCGNMIHVNTLGSGPTAVDFDYILNSVTVTTTYNTSSFTGDVPEAVMFPTQSNSSSLSTVAVIPAWKDTQLQTCGSFNEACNYPTGQIAVVDPTNKPTVDGEFLAGGTPSIGYSPKEKVYKGRIGMRTTDGELIPMLRYAQFYCNNISDPTYSFSNPIKQAIEEDLPRMNNIIDLVVPLAPQLEIAGGFNVNGFKPSEQLTSEDRGRTDVVSEPGGSGKCYPGKSHQSKITFGDAATTGTSLTGLPFYMTTYAIGTGGTYLYQEGDQKFINNLNTIREIEAALNCDPNDEVTQRLFCDGTGLCDASLNIANCREIHSLLAPHFMAHFIANNKYTKFNGSTTDVDFDKSDFLYRGNGEHYLDGALSGDAHEYVNSAGEPATNIAFGDLIGIDSEWSSVYIEAQDPFARGCTGCMRTVFSDDNYALITEYERSGSLTEDSNPHTI